jgi:nucleoside-diphosphate-sugar epimerase
VLVTGATGFIGRATAQRLTSLGASVLAAARRPRDGALALDLGDPESARRLLADFPCDVIIHTVGHPFAARTLERVLPTFRDNLAATVHLLTAAAERKVARVVLCGSLEEPESKDLRDALSSPYALSKAAASAYAALFHSLFALPVVTARLFMVYGPGQHDFTKLIPGSIVKLLRGEAPEISSPHRPVDWIYVDDVVEGLLACAAAPAIEGRTIDIGTGVLTSVGEIAQILHTLIPGSPPPRLGSAPRPNEQVRSARLDQTQTLLPWSPRIPLREGLERTIRWARSLPTPPADR